MMICRKIIYYLPIYNYHIFYKHETSKIKEFHYDEMFETEREINAIFVNKSFYVRM